MSQPPASVPSAEGEAAYHAQVRTDLRRNFAAHLAHGLLGQTGFRLINAPTFVPAYLHALSGSDLAVGIARGLQSFGMFLSPILSATLVEHRRRVLPVGFLVGGMMRVQVLGIALAGLLLPDSQTLVAVCLFLGLFGFFLGMQGVIFSFLMSKVIPVELRGRLMGLRNTLAGLTASGVAYLAGTRLVDANVLGDGYAATFLLAFVREPEPPQLRQASTVRDRLQELPALLRSDREFTAYFLCRALATMGRMSLPFYILYAKTQVEVSGETLGVLTMVFLLANTMTNILWGWLADHRGFRLVFLLSLSVWVLSTLLLMQSAAFESLLVVFMGVGAGSGGFQLSGQNLVLEFGERQDLPMRIAIANSASEGVGSIGPILGGTLVTLWSYTEMFWVSIFFQLAAILMVVWKVKDPRHRRRVGEPISDRAGSG